MASAAEARERGDVIGQAFALWLAAGSRLRSSRLEVVSGTRGGRAYRPQPGALGEGALAEAEELIATARALLEERGEKWLRSLVEIECGLLCSARGQSASAPAHHRLAYRLRQDLRDPGGMGSALVYLADALIGEGDYEGARVTHEEAGTLVRTLGDNIGISELERSMAAVALAAGEAAAAAALLASSLRRAQAVGFNNQVVSVLRSMAEILIDYGEAAAATEVVSVIATHPSTTPFTRAIAESLQGEVEGQLGASDLVEAERVARESSLDEIAARAVAALRRARDPRGNPLLSLDA
jgi:hypothetical protein